MPDLRQGIGHKVLLQLRSYCKLTAVGNGQPGIFRVLFLIVDQTPLCAHTSRSNIICQHKLNTFTNKCIQDVFQSNATFSESPVPDIHSFLPFLMGHSVNIFISTKIDPLLASGKHHILWSQVLALPLSEGALASLENQKKNSLYLGQNKKVVIDSSLNLLGLFSAREQGIDIRKVCLEQVTE